MGKAHRHCRMLSCSELGSSHPGSPSLELVEGMGLQGFGLWLSLGGQGLQRCFDLTRLRKPSVDLGPWRQLLQAHQRRLLKPQELCPPETLAGLATVCLSM